MNSTASLTGQQSYRDDSDIPVRFQESVLDGHTYTYLYSQETKGLRSATGTPTLMWQRAALHTFVPYRSNHQWGYYNARLPDRYRKGQSYIQWKEQPLSRVRSGCTCVPTAPGARRTPSAN